MPRPADPNAREALVAAARAEFARKGLRGARIEDITAACGLSKGAFYLHFESKEALFGELVQGFAGEMSRAAGTRRAEMLRRIELEGAITRHDVTHRTPRYLSWIEFETSEDQRLLEHLWSFRDIVGVLVSGAQGTAFESVIWTLADQEVERIKAEFGTFQQKHVCRSDIRADVFGSLIVGTWVLLSVRMSRMAEKPDLADWARSIHTLIREGSVSQQHESHRSKA